MKSPKSFYILKVLIAVSVLSGGYSFAQEENTGAPTVGASTTTTKTTTRTKVKERKAILNFEDELVEGSTQKPELFYLFQKKNFNYNRLIKLRENFLPEMRQTTEHVQRVRGGN